MKDKILDIDFSDYQEVGPAPYFLSPIEIIKLQLADILDEQGFDDVMEDWGEEYYFRFQDELYSFYIQDSGKSDDPGCNYGEVGELKKVIENER